MTKVDLWREYVAFLREHVPHAHANLASGATDAAISRLERKIGIILPDSVKGVWRENDGQRLTSLPDNDVNGTPCLPSLSFLSVNQVECIWQMWTDLRARLGVETFARLDSGASSIVQGLVKPLYSSPKWIPLWADPSRADYIGLDFDPGEVGRVGQVINFGRDEERHWCCANSFDDLLRLLLTGVQSGKWHAHVIRLDDGEELPWFGDPAKSLFTELRRLSENCPRQ